jgi:hypothetical protein
MSGITAIKAEQSYQRRQKGYTRAHDREHDNDQLAFAAAVYALPGGIVRDIVRRLEWPADWDFKPAPVQGDVEDRIRELAKAGAMIASEIDRLECPRALSDDRGSR